MASGLEGKVALITGAAQADGIGFAAATALREAGAEVVLSDLARDRQALSQRREEIGASLALHMDVTKRCEIDAALEQIQQHCGGLDIVFNNAGSPAGVGPFMEISEAQWNISLQVNLMGAVNLCQAAMPLLLKSGNASIINNASMSGLGVVANMSAYNASKFALVGLTKSLATEFGHQGVRINAICPGMVWTQMGKLETEHSRLEGESLADAKARLAGRDIVPMERWASAAEIAQAVCFLAGPQASYINGVALPVAGGMAPGL
ncbi:MAG: SDR family oxidoreductase [Cellvibrionaceae bacterium]|nr:SDR family oxidoreductase [Cellvibrionaceae bacterium]